MEEEKVKVGMVEVEMVEEERGVKEVRVEEEKVVGVRVEGVKEVRVGETVQLCSRLPLTLSLEKLHPSTLIPE